MMNTKPPSHEESVSPEHLKARWLRQAIGDEPTAALYLPVAAARIWVGLNIDWTFGRR